MLKNKKEQELKPKKTGKQKFNVSTCELKPT